VRVPAHVIDASRAAFDLHDPSAAIADLVYDSVLDGRASRTRRRLVFQCRDRRRRIRVDVASDRMTLHVRLAPPRAADITVLQPDRQATARTDRRGRARVSPVPPGLVCVLVQSGSTAPATVRTAWIAT
jgi:hypothetical protein